MDWSKRLASGDAPTQAARATRLVWSVTGLTNPGPYCPADAGSLALSREEYGADVLRDSRRVNVRTF